MDATFVRAEDLFESYELEWVPPADAEMQRLGDILATWKGEEARRMLTVEAGKLLKFELRKKRRVE